MQRHPNYSEEQFYSTTPNELGMWPIDKTVLYDEVCACIEAGELSPKGFELLRLIVVNANRRLVYKYAEDKRDCIAFAFMEVLKYWGRFDPEKSTNAFAYYTQMAKNGFAKGWDVIYPKRYKGTISMDSSEGDGIFTL